MDLGISGKTALVLGASRGLGQAIAQTLAGEGVVVHAAARNVEAIAAWSRGMAGVHAHALDLNDLAAVDALVERLLADGGVDILINNGGGPKPGTAVDSQRADWIDMFEPMAANLFHLTGRLLPGMRARKWGRIVTVVSSGVEQPIPNLALSNGIRAAVVGWSKTLATEVAVDGITVNVVLPGRIHTPRVDELDQAASKRTGQPMDDVKAAAAAAIPVGRYGDPQEFADVVAFLASQRASYVTGSRIRVDGGATRSI